MPGRANDSLRIQKCVRRRHNAFRAIRQFFQEQNFVEIDAPILINANAVEEHIDPIEATLHIGLGRKPQQWQFQTSPELWMKRLLSHGLERIFSFGHVCRDRELGPIHLPEFGLLEWYRAFASLDDLVVDCEEIFRRIAMGAFGRLSFERSGMTIDLSQPFERRDMDDLWQQLTGINLRKALMAEEREPGSFVRIVGEAGYALRDGASMEDAFHHVMLTRIEPNIGTLRPCVVSKWPKQLAALAKAVEGEPLYADRFEIYAAGVELANAFNELVNADEQLRRFAQANEARRSLGKNSITIDLAFLDALRHMPSACGIAVGVDRFLLLMMGVDTLEQVYPFSRFFGPNA